ncbi:MAG: hypothetical protein CMH75_00945 [Nitrospina sp.]|nr:hypothetical protein [Nitrospina sp.]|tara:strand:- start:465 stop:968 length:504 start_codon:yes stop_codon:yes gene_type:complete
MKRLMLMGMVLFFSLIISNNSFSADTDLFANILKKIDKTNCTQPEKLPNFYSKNLVILQDDKRLLLENRIKDYRQMMSDFRGINCQVQRQVLAGHVGAKVGYVLVDEIISVTSKSVDNDERQHGVCNYNFVKAGSSWKITLEHCSSLPDYSINPGDDALYYFHNPIY